MRADAIARNVTIGLDVVTDAATVGVLACCEGDSLSAVDSSGLPQIFSMGPSVELTHYDAGVIGMA